MSEQVLRLAGLFLLVTGFILWAYGFVYSSFWYANADTSILEPVRVWASQFVDHPVRPGVMEEIIGLVVAFTGIVLQMVTYAGKR
jgi:uncharacterized membrane protein